jgi:RNA polymerase sigma-70 factor, ECF subfamily
MQSAFITAYDEYADAIFKHCYFRVYDRERACELMQETFTKTWEYLAMGNTIKNLRAFLYKTANHLIIDEVRRRKRRKEESYEEMAENGFEIAGEQGEDAISIIGNKQRAGEVIKRIREPYRTAILMRYVDGLSITEIASALGTTKNVVSVRISRGLEGVRNQFARHG